MIEKKFFDINKYLTTDYSGNAVSIVNFLVGLYYATGEKYRVNGYKLEQLLIIYQLWCLKHNKTGLLPTNIKLQIDSCRFMLSNPFIFPNMYAFDDLISGKVEEKKERINDLIEFKNIPEKYTHKKNGRQLVLDDEVKEIIIEIFRAFGNWDIYSIGFELKNIFLEIQNSLYLTSKYLTNDVMEKGYKYIYDIKDNEIINFINQYPCKETANNGKSFMLEKFISDFEGYFINMTLEEKKEFLNSLNSIEVEKNKVYKK